MKLPQRQVEDQRAQENFEQIAVAIDRASVTALPTGNIPDGREIYYVADATNGVVWHLKYRAASSSAYKWERVGGPRLLAFVGTQQSMSSATTTAYTDLATNGPDITVPLAGDYEVQVGAAIQAPASAGATIAAMSYAVGGTGAADADGLYMASFNPDQTQEGSLAGPVARKTGIAAGTLLRAKYKINSGTANWQYRWMSVAPVRVG